MTRYIKEFKKALIYFITIFVLTFIFRINTTKSMLNSYSEINNLDAFIQILKRNTLSYLWILLGIVLGSIIVYLFLTINAVVLAVLISKFNSISYLLLVIPHGIIEIITFLLLCSIILKSQKDNYLNKKDFKYIAVIYIFIVIAAFVEAYITPLLISFI